MIPNRQCPFEPSPTSTPIPQKILDSEDHPHRIHEVPSPTQAQIDIVRYTWERVSEIRLPQDEIHVSASHAFGLAFYEALFEMDPSLKPLFSNIFQQARALAGMVSFIARVPNVATNTTTTTATTESRRRTLTIREINAKKRKETKANNFQESITAASTNVTHEGESTEHMLQKLRELGARHYFYNVQSHQLELMGPAVLVALRKRLGKEFLPEVEEAWTKAYAFAAYHMKIGLEAQASSENRRRSVKIAPDRQSNKSNCTVQ